MNNPNCFPKGLDSHITLQGPCGILEALTTSSTTKNNFFTKTALLCHPHPLHGGSMHNKVIHTLSRAFHHCHYNTIRFNYRGVGKSTGQYGNYLGEIEDALAIVNWLKKTQSSHKIFLAGFSFGAVIAYYFNFNILFIVMAMLCFLSGCYLYFFLPKNFFQE